MTIQLHNLIKPFLQMSEEEQLTLVREIRHNKDVLKPPMRATKQAKKQQATKSRRNSTKAISLFSSISSMTLQQKLDLLRTLENG